MEPPPIHIKSPPPPDAFAWTYPQSFIIGTETQHPRSNRITPSNLISPTASYCTRYRRPLIITFFVSLVSITILAVILGSFLDDGKNVTNDMSLTTSYPDDQRDYYNSSTANINTTLPQPTPHWHHIGPLLSGRSPDSQFGFSLSLNHNATILAVGSPQFNDGRGTVVVYRLTKRNIYHWTRMTIEEETGGGGGGGGMTGANRGDNVGATVALNAEGTRLAYAASGNGGVGVINVWEWSSTAASWIPMTDGGDGDDRFRGSRKGDGLGLSLSFSGDGNRLVAGATAGYLMIMAYDDEEGRWGLLPEVRGEDEADWMVGALSGDGGRLVVGFPFRDEVRLYEWLEVGEVWDEPTGEVLSGVSGSGFGNTVDISLDGKTIAVGTDGGNFVRVYEYHQNHQTIHQRGLITGTDDDQGQFGSTISLSASGKRLAIGSPFYTSSRHERGRVAVYQFDDNDDSEEKAATTGSQWNEVGNVLTGDSDGCFAGYAIKLSAEGEGVAVGAPKGDSKSMSNPGVVKVFWLE